LQDLKQNNQADKLDNIGKYFIFFKRELKNFIKEVDLNQLVENNGSYSKKYYLHLDHQNDYVENDKYLCINNRHF